MLPEGLEIKDWVNPLHINKDIWLKKEPFEHARIEDFFQKEVFQEIQCTTKLIKEDYYSRHPNGVYKFATFPSKAFLKFIYSQTFTDFMESHIGYRLARSKSYPFPQVYVFGDEGKELKVHTDYNAEMPRTFGMIFYIHNYWDDNCGGVLNFYHKDNLNNPAISYQPIPNSCIIFKVSPYSYHALTHSKPSWDRVTLIVDWDLENESERL